MDIRFIHGWGYAPSFWDRLTPFFADKQTTLIDLGFLETDIPPPATIKSSEKAIYITHSLGTLYALQHHTSDIAALIVINGFYNFAPFTDEKTLTLMARGLKRAPEAQMKAFWKTCGLTPSYAALNTEKLAEGLENLRSLNTESALENLSVPILVLTAEDDPIAPFSAMQKHWQAYPLQLHLEGGHILPYTQSAWCAERIKEFLGEHKLDR